MSGNPMKRGRGSKRGIALIMSFLLLTLLTVVVLQLVYSARVELSLARNFRDDLENVYAARSAVDLAQAMLNEEWGGFDSPEAQWTFERTGLEIGETEVSFITVDEESKFFLPLLIDQDEKRRNWARGVFLRLVTLARKNTENEDEPSPEKLLETILAWAEKGETGTAFKPGGGGLSEDDQERRFLSLEELLFLEGFTEDLLYGQARSARQEEEDIRLRSEAADDISNGLDLDALADSYQMEEDEEDEPTPLAELLTVWGTGRINLNTAPLILIRAMHPAMTPDIAQAIDDARNLPPQTQENTEPDPETAAQSDEPSGFRTPAALRKIEGVIDTGQNPPLDMYADLVAYITVKSETFRVRVVVKNERLVQRYETLIAADTLDSESQSSSEDGSGDGSSGGGDETNQDGGDTSGSEDENADQGTTVSQEPVKAKKIAGWRILRMKPLD